ncbi:hypothetical protein HY490_02845 [Candidatus Woesearchaeota archaeon]|nr:hypothetical protein [Candidatus Woesearchaeota archaeon]
MTEKTAWQLLTEEFAMWDLGCLDENLAKAFASVIGRKVESFETLRAGLPFPVYLDPKTCSVPDRIFMLPGHGLGKMVYVAYRCDSKCNSLVMGLPLIFQEEAYHSVYGVPGLLFHCKECGSSLPAREKKDDIPQADKKIQV